MCPVASVLWSDSGRGGDLWDAETASRPLYAVQGYSPVESGERAHKGLQMHSVFPPSKAKLPSSGGIVEELNEAAIPVAEAPWPWPWSPGSSARR